MLRRASVLTERARERIRAAREHDPHAWPERDDDRAILVHDDDPEPIDFVEIPPDDDPDGGATTPPLGSPEPGAPDVDGAVASGGVSGPPQGGRPHRPGERSRRLMTTSGRDGPPEAGVPNGLRTAAAYSWRFIVVIAGFYVLLYAAAYVAVVVVPVIVALLLAALLQPGAAYLVRHGWPRSLSAFTMLIVGLGVVAGIITLVVERFSAGFSDLAGQVSEGIGQVQSFVVRTFPITRNQLEDAVGQFQQTLVDNQDSIASGALTTAATVGEVIAGFFLALFTLFFFLKDGRSIWLWLVGLFPGDSRAYIDEAARRAWRTLVSYVRATAAVALIDAIGIGIGLAILGVPLVIPLAALVFLGAFIPILGSFLAGSVAVLVALVSQGPITALIALAIVVLVMQVEGHILQPLLLGRAVRVHPLAIVLAIAAGLLIAGIFGALIAVPIVACANVAGTYLSRRHDGPRPPEPRPERARPAVTAG
ncbi:AI-2E family transporter [Blastococcus sp. CT_GayMR16]|uniref:AI-2E family transporter n=1 Tax=Blastococcus sp. CT_GayMR16 TaxID=2559607 RepID=UPI00107364D3|nr:AI-2E family transporter [Blastococcus sp. CT_GayMR16]TFV86441.1 AI-2E family transporter [Blastococcus sp. CT_GayMR16]